MEFDKLSRKQKDELRRVFETLEAPITDPKGNGISEGERFFGSVVVFLFGASYTDTTRIPGYVRESSDPSVDMSFKLDAREVHGVDWHLPDGSKMVVEVLHLEQACNTIGHGGESSFSFTPERIIQVDAIIGYLREHFAGDLREDRVEQLHRLVEAVRKGMTD